MKRFPGWTMADGHRIPIARMTDRHLVNTLRMLERYAEQAAADLPFPMFQGEMAQSIAEQEWYTAHEQGMEPAHPRYPDLVREAERRGLLWSR